MTARRKHVRVSRREFCERFGVSPQLITKNTKPGAAWHAALEGKLIDMAHPVIVEWAAERGTPVPDSRSLVKTGKAAANEKRAAAIKSTATANPVATKPSGEEDVEALGDMTIAQVLEIHGTEAAFKAYLDAMKTIEDISSKRLANAEKEGKLIARELVDRHVFAPVERMFTQILGELPKSVATTSQEAYKAGQTVQDVEAAIYKTVAKIVKDTKAKFTKATQ